MVNESNDSPFKTLFSASEKFKEEIEKRVEEGQLRIKAICDRYVEEHIPIADFGQRSGPFHAGSILAWARLAELANVPVVPVNIISHIPIEDAWASVDGKSLSLEGDRAFKAATVYAEQGGFWRTDLCASEEVKYAASVMRGPPRPLYFHLNDSRIMDMNTYMSEITIVGRPLMNPVITAKYATEFRVFQGGGVAKDMAVSFYYPQAGHFNVTPELEEAMTLSVHYASAITKARQEMGLIPWLPETGDPDDRNGSTLDFMLTQDKGLVMIDAGPGYGNGAHACCFLERPVEGRKWHVDEGVEIR